MLALATRHSKSHLKREKLTQAETNPSKASVQQPGIIKICFKSHCMDDTKEVVDDAPGVCKRKIPCIKAADFPSTEPGYESFVL